MFGHRHQQFRRPGPNGTQLVNPGSVGAPLDGDTRGLGALYEHAKEPLSASPYLLSLSFLQPSR
jgi:predicted phosphodiesterase